MLIAIAGSQGVGKSLLLNALQSTYPIITRKTSRSILSEWNVTLSQVNNDHALTVKFQNEILERKKVDEQEAASSPHIYFTERTYMDLFTYALVALGKDNQYSDWLDDYYIRCLAAQSTYHGICYLTAGHFKPVADGVRGTNIHYSYMVDLLLQDYTISSRPSNQNRVLLVHTPDMNERVAQVVKYVGQCS